jgi:hypothetical protein
MNLDNFLAQGSRILEEASKAIQEFAKKLPAPEVYALDRRVATQICAAVAVDAGQSLFKGALQEAGIAIFQIASSLEGDEPRTIPFWINPNLPEDQKEEYIDAELDRLFEQDKIVQEFVRAMKWQNAGGGIQPSQKSSGAEVGNYVRDLLEWAELYRLAKILDEERKLKVTGHLQPILLRDGVLRFGTTASNVAERLGKLFEDLDIPIFGLGKRSMLLRMPVIKAWLTIHKVYERSGAFCIWLDEETFRIAGWKLDRYFGTDGFRFGRYVLVRFDNMPGSRNIFAMDIPHYLYLNRKDDVLNLLSSIAQYISATAYPLPGYPLPLQIAHDKVTLRNDRTQLLERALRTKISPEALEFLINLDLGGQNAW